MEEKLTRTLKTEIGRGAVKIIRMKSGRHRAKVELGPLEKKLNEVLSAEVGRGAAVVRRKRKPKPIQ